VVIDRVDAQQAMTVKSYLHGGRGTLTTTGGEHTWTYAADRYGPAARLRTWIVAPGATTTVRQGELTYIKGDFAEFPYLETISKTMSMPWMTLLKPVSSRDAAPFTVADRSTGTHTAFVIDSAQEHTLVAAGRRRALVLDGVETDGKLVIVRRDHAGKVLQHFVQGATYLRVAGQSLPL